MKSSIKKILKNLYSQTMLFYSKSVGFFLAPFTKRNIIEGRTLLKNIRPPLSAYETNNLISEMIMSNKPFFVTRLGEIETRFLCHYFEFKTFSKTDKLFNFLTHFEWTFTLKKTVTKRLRNNAGFFPVDENNLNCFYKKMTTLMPQADLLASWLRGENYFQKQLESAKTCHLPDIESYHHSNPWSQHLKGKHVLVIHPFSKSIEKQYTINRTRLFRDPLVLPEFKLSTLTAVQSVAGNIPKEFNDWFQALNYMYTKSLEINPDIVILGCGAYGFPLGAMLKAAGKQVIHLGGATQILFGIKGLRWDNHPRISKLYNEYWVRPSQEEKPTNYKNVESGCYW